MKPRQLSWKWLLLGLVVLLLVGLAVLPRQFGTSSELRDRVAAELSAWTGGTVTLTEPVNVRYYPPLSMRAGFVLSNATKLPLVQSIDARDIKISFSLPDLLLGRLKIDAVRLSRPKIALKDMAAPSSPDQTPEALVTDLLADTPVGVIDLGRGTIVTASGQRLASHLDARLEANGGGALSVLGAFDFRNEVVRFAATNGETTETEEGATAPITVRVTSAPVTAKLSGTARFGESLGFDGDMQAEMDDARRFLNWVGMKLPEGESLKRLTASGTVHWNGATLLFDDGSFALDGNAADGLLAVTVGARPRVEGTLAFERLDLNPYLGGGAEVSATAKGALFDWALLKYLDADLRISAAEIAASNVKLGRGGFTITAKDGAISSEVGELELCGGEAGGRAGLDLSTARTRASLIGSFNDVNFESCLQPLGLEVPLKGVGSLRIDVSTGGKTWEELIRGLAGGFQVTAENGAVPINFPQLLATGVPPGESSWSHDTATPFETLEADCRLSAGHIWCQSFNMQTGSGLISGSGGVDVGRQTLDWDFLIANPVAPLNASQLVMETPPRVTIRGPLAQPLIQRANRPTLGDGSTQTNPESTQVTPR